MTEQGLHHREREYLGVANAGAEASRWCRRDTLGMSFEKIVAGHVQCCSEVVQAGVHIDSLSVIGLAAPILDALHVKSHATHQSHHRESFI